jgi:drug/metabolite transporter (DMT)-like permease
MQVKVIYIVLFLVSVFISSLSQIILKKSAGKTYENRLREYLNVPVISAYFLFFLSSLLTVAAYRYVPLSMGTILEASGYIWVTVLGVIFLRERVSPRKLAGLAVIIIGIVVFNI